MKNDWKVDPSDLNDIIASLVEAGIEVTHGLSDDFVLVEEENGSQFILPREFNIFTNPVKYPLQEQTKYEKTDNSDISDHKALFRNIIEDEAYKSSCIIDVSGIAA